MAEPRFNNPYFWPPPPAMPGQLDNLVLINKIKEQLMAEKIRTPHLPPATVPSQQPLLAPPNQVEGGQHVMSKAHQMPVLHSHSPSQPDIALHARPASSSVTEHVVADPSSWAYFFQHVFQPAWYYFGDGCEVTRATWKHLEAAGFSDLKLRHIEAPLIFMIKPHIIGYAVK